MSTENSTFDDTDGSNFPVPDSSDMGSESYYDGNNNNNNNSNDNNHQRHHHSAANYTDTNASSSIAGQPYYYHNNNQDATEIVHEMYLALLYLLSNPDEFKKALQAHPPQGATTLDEWNAELDEDEDEDESCMTSGTTITPLPFIVFADDAEVVLPQAHTASQLFGIEKMEGIELEAAAGIPALSQLFLRWLALMPGGDHLNIIDPPGLTVMRIAGGRYRVTAVHRVVWTWMNEFASLSIDGENLSDTSSFQMDDLVTLTIVDVFETDKQGRLLSYCPTFDNKKVKKTNPASETIRKSSQKFFSMLGKAQKAVAKSEVNKKASEQLQKKGILQHAKNVADNVKHRVEEAVSHMQSPNKKATKKDPTENITNSNKNHNIMEYTEFKQAITAVEEAATGSSSMDDPVVIDASETPTTGSGSAPGDTYASKTSTDDDQDTTAEI